jgi:hypothetical protein
LSLTLEVFSSAGPASVDVTWSLSSDHRFWFDDDGAPTKRVADPAVVVGDNPTTISRRVTIVSGPGERTAAQFFVTASVRDPRTGARLRTAAVVIPATAVPGN